MGDPIFELFRSIAIFKNSSHIFDTPGKLSKSSLKDYKNPRQIRAKVCNKLYADFCVYEKYEHKDFREIFWGFQEISEIFEDIQFIDLRARNTS